MEQKIIHSSSPEGLNSQIQKYIDEGWKPVGSHAAIVIHAQNRYAGKQHMDTLYKTEYSQSIQKE